MQPEIRYCERMLGASNVLQWRRSVPHPWLGMEFTNLYAADVVTLEEIVQLFPLVCKGVIVEEDSQWAVLNLTSEAVLGLLELC
ncbi:hypothetical protein NC651_037955 [Populus alba x Populus x berolinensis]|nr:hypothetical protein NC651_037955 [Populus alba x Populus x berolinensis]